jgi:hypothetical protein
MFDLRALKLFTAIALVATSVFAQDHSSEQSEAQITGTHYRRLLRPLSLFAKFSYQDPNAECTVYSYPPVAQNIHNFPTIWQPATLLANDSAGQALWQKIAPGVPNIAPKGQLNGSTINETYDIVNDPDCCEWHFLLLTLPFQEGEREERRVTARVTIRTMLSGTCHRRAAAVRQLRDRGTENLVAMSLRHLSCHR